MLNMQAIKTAKLSGKTIRYQKMVNKVTEMINSGELKAGHRLPSLREVSRHFGVSLGLARRCFCQLQDKGLLIQKHGSGSFVNPYLKFNGTKLVALLTSYHKQDIEGYFEPLFEVANLVNVLPMISTLDHNKDWQSSISKVVAREPDALMIDVEAMRYPMGKILKLIGDTPCCFVNRWEWDKLKPSNAVIIDYAKAYGAALKYLKNCGHKKIFVVIYHTKPFQFMEKFLNEAAEIAGMSFKNELIYCSNAELNESIDKLKELYNLYKPTAIFGLSDYLVHEVIKKGIKICPEICSLDKIGFYDLKYSNSLGYEFSTMKIDFGKMWKEAFSILDSDKHHVSKIMPELIER